jgi:hypothetical protein
VSSIPPIPRLGEMIANCAHNRDLADMQRRRFRKQLEGMPPGRERDVAEGELNRHHSDYRHWADYVAYYRGRASTEGEGVVPAMVMGVVQAIERRRSERAPEPDRRLPREREPGDDDADEAIPF